MASFNFKLFCFDSSSDLQKFQQHNALQIHHSDWMGRSITVSPAFVFAEIFLFTVRTQPLGFRSAHPAEIDPRSGTW